MSLIKHSHPLFELLFSPLLSLSPHTFSLLLSPPPLNMMRFGERESSRRGDTDTLKNGTATTFICGESGDHVHFPPRHHARSPRPRHAPSWIFSSGSELNFRADNYKECRKNQAAQFGCTAYDGCGEFVATDDDSLKCAACGCHRSYHRRDPADFPIHSHDNGVGSDAAAAILNALKLPALQSRQICSSPSDCGGQDGKDLSTGESQKKNLRSSGGGGEATTTGTGKRFKSKFTAEQKERMCKYAEKIGWNMRNESGEEVNKFCAEIGVKRENFRVWMNNHKTKSSAS